LTDATGKMVLTVRWPHQAAAKRPRPNRKMPL
jgi:hypothetical protein